MFSLSTLIFSEYNTKAETGRLGSNRFTALEKDASRNLGHGMKPTGLAEQSVLCRKGREGLC